MQRKWNKCKYRVYDCSTTQCETQETTGSFSKFDLKKKHKKKKCTTFQGGSYIRGSIYERHNVVIAGLMVCQLYCTSRHSLCVSWSRFVCPARPMEPRSTRLPMLDCWRLDPGYSTVSSSELNNSPGWQWSRFHTALQYSMTRSIWIEKLLFELITSRRAICETNVSYLFRYAAHFFQLFFFFGAIFFQVAVLVFQTALRALIRTAVRSHPLKNRSN